MKLCRGCETEKEEVEFHQNADRCKACRKEYHKAWYQKNRERNLAQSKKWQKEHPESCRERTKRWRDKDPRRKLLSDARGRAKRKGIEFSIKVEDIVIPERCPVFGLPFQVGEGAGGHTPMSPSLDRVDSSRGYVPGNVQVISYRANTIKNDATLEELESICSYMRRVSCASR